MGKSSKSKGKKLAKQERALHLKNVEVWEKTKSKIDKKLSSSLGGLPTNGKKRERIRLLEDRLQLTLNIEESFAFINRYQSYKTDLSLVCSSLLLEHLLSANYIQAYNAYNEMMKYPLTQECRSRIKPFSNLLLLWTEGENIDQNDTIAKTTVHDIIVIIQRPEAVKFLELVFVEEALKGLSRQHLFKTVKLLSLGMLKNVDKHDIFKMGWMTMARTFLVFSYIGEFRISLLGNDEQSRYQTVLDKVQKMKKIMPLENQLSSPSTEYLASSLFDFYTFICEKEENFLTKECIESLTEKKYIENLEEYIALRSRDAQDSCTTCQDEDTPDHEGLVCQGCRVVSYCCKHHQRINHLHHEETGTRGLGHKHLCPVFKAYRRKRDNADTSKQGHLDRKFQRACKRFLRGTVESA